MSKTLYWLQTGGCGGDTMSLLSADGPDFIEMLEQLDINVLWHPSMSTTSHFDHRRLLDSILSDSGRIDILCVEGTVVRGPGGTGMYDTFCGEPRKNLVARLAHQAEFVVAVGTCASFGGIGADGEVEATGLQFHKNQRGGFLGPAFLSRSGAPVINLPGCPCHHQVISGALLALSSAAPLPLNELQAPVEWYDLMIHQGCMRDEYHEYRVEEDELGNRGCLFFHLGCHGPLARGVCNKFLWNGRSSKTRVGVPCLGCTRPDFPQAYPFFQTRNIVNIPLDLPEGVDRAHYLAYKGMAAAASPQRLRKRETRL